MKRKARLFIVLFAVIIGAGAAFWGTSMTRAIRKEQLRGKEMKELYTWKEDDMPIVWPLKT